MLTRLLPSSTSAGNSYIEEFWCVDLNLLY